MKKLYLLLALLLIIIVVVVVLIVGKKDELHEIDITDVDFDYEVDVCSEYFEMLECIIDKDPDEKFTKQIRIDLKNEVKEMQGYWKSFSKEELTEKCVEELSNFDNEIMKEKLRSFGCLK